MAKRMKKGSPEAKAWGRKMKRMRKLNSGKSRTRTHAPRPRSRRVNKPVRAVRSMAKRKVINLKNKHKTYIEVGVALIGGIMLGRVL